MPAAPQAGVLRGYLPGGGGADRAGAEEAEPCGGFKSPHVLRRLANFESLDVKWT